MIRAILFDKDGTLLDFHATWVPAFRVAAGAVSRDAGRPELAERLLAIGGLDAATGRCDPGSVLGSGDNTDIARLWARACGLDDVARVTARIETVFAREIPRSAAPVGDLVALFTRLRDRGFALGLATMDSEALARDVIAGLALHAHLGFVCGYDSGHGAKPGPGMVAAFCAALGVRPAEVLVVGDTLHDVHMGRAAGVGVVVGVLTGAGTRELLAPHCDHVLEDVFGLESLLSG